MCLLRKMTDVAAKYDFVYGVKMKNRIVEDALNSFIHQKSQINQKSLQNRGFD